MKFQAEILPAPEIDAVRYVNRSFITASIAEVKTEVDHWLQSLGFLRFLEVEQFWYSFPEFPNAWCREIFQITECGPVKSVGTLLMQIEVRSAPLTYSEPTAS